MPTIILSLFGFEGAFVAIAVMVLGLVVTKSYRLTFLGAILSSPFLLYTSGYPAVHGLGLLVLVCNACAAIALSYDRRWLGVLLTVPFLAYVNWITWIVGRHN